MRRLLCRGGWLALCSFLLCWHAAPAESWKGQLETQPESVTLIQKAIAGQLERLEALYQYLHAHPELSLQEEQTAARMARELRDLGFEVTEKVGGHGVVGVLKNGKGPTILVRTDLDALPVAER